MGAKWLRNGTENSKVGEAEVKKSEAETTVRGRDRVEARFMEVDGKLAEIGGDTGGIRIVQQNQESGNQDKYVLNAKADNTEGNKFEKETVMIDPKRRRVNDEVRTGENTSDITNGLSLEHGPKNVIGAGAVEQARPMQ